jgi:hypothetical protein
VQDYNAPKLDELRRQAAAYWSARAEEKAMPDSIWFYSTIRDGGTGLMIWRGTLADAGEAWTTLQDVARQSGKRGSLVWCRNYPEGYSASFDQVSFTGA